MSVIKSLELIRACLNEAQFRIAHAGKASQLDRADDDTVSKRVGGAKHQYIVVTVSRNPEIVPNPPTVKARSETMWSQTIWRGSTPG